MLEPLSAGVVSAVLRRHLGDAAECTHLERGPIGNGQETWFLDVLVAGERRALVLRRTAEAGPLEWTDRGAETEAMTAVADRGLPVPRVHWCVTDGDELGAPYMVMDRAAGTPATLATGEQRLRLVADLARQLARLHAEAIPDPQGRDAVTATREEVERWRRRYTDNGVATVPLIDALLAWCVANVPDLDSGAAILLWGDAGAHNALGTDGRVTGLLDWELAHHGHPLEDLAAAIWFETDVGTAPEALIDAYEAASGTAVDRDALRYFLVLICVTRSVMSTVGAGAFVRGRTHAPNLAGLGLDLPAVNLARAAEHAGWGQLPELEPPAAGGPGDVLRPSGEEIDDGVARFLRDELLARLTDRRTRRGVKTAVALLETAALRARSEPGVTAVRRAASEALLADLATEGVRGDLATVAATVETDETLAELRPRVRAHLLTDLARQRTLLTPLHRLYHRTHETVAPTRGAP